MTTLRPYQVEAKRAIYEEFRRHQSTLLVLATGCHSPETQVLMADGRARPIADVAVGDALLGPDGQPRLVTAVHSGESQLVRIVPTKGEPWLCTTDHRLTLVHTRTALQLDVPVAEWLLWPEKKRRAARLIRAAGLGLPPDLYSFTAEPLPGLRPYAGVTVDGDHRYLLADFTVTHNCGKTVVFTSIVADGYARGRRVLVLAHRDELIQQAAATIERVLGIAPGVEKGDRRDASEPGLSAPGQGAVVVSSVQTMVRRLDKIPADSFDLVIRDEAHHALSPTDRKVLGHFADAKLLGVTATPERGDKKGLGQIFASVAYDLGLADGIEQGWLVPVRMRQVELDGLDLSKVKRQRGDFQRDQLAEVMEGLDMLRAVSVSVVDAMGSDRHPLVFCVSVRHAHMQADSIREVMRDRGMTGRVEALDGSAPEHIRREVVEAFRRGDVRVLCGCDLFTEGFDAPVCDLVAMARPTMSRVLYCLDIETEVLTRDGWRAHTDVDAGDCVAVYRVEHDDIVWQPAIAKVVRPLADGERFVRLSLPALDIRVTDQHRMVYRSRHGRAKTMSRTMLDTAAELTRIKSQLQLPVAAVEASEGVSLTSAELRFIGLVMSDGTINKYNGAIAISQASHQPWIEEIQKLIDDCGFKNTRTERIRATNFVASTKTTSWTISKGKPRGTGKHLRGWGDLAAFLSKDLAPALENVTPAQLDDLLYGLWLGDGAKQPKRADWTKRTYDIACGRNKVMAERLQSLCVRRGLRCVLTTFTWNAHQQYMLRIKKGAWRSVINHGLRRFTTEEGTPGEMVWCLQTEAGTLVVRRRGKPFITGNCQMLGRGTRPLAGIVDGPDTAEARRAAIAASAKRDLLVLDFVGNTGKHEIVSAINLLGEDVEDEEAQQAAKLLERGETDDILAALEMVRAMRAAAARDRLAREGDFFALFGLVRRTDGWQAQPTPAQSEAIKSRGVPVAGLDKRSANQVLAELARRRAQGLCTYKQAVALVRAKVPLGTVAEFKFDAAKNALDVLARHQWRPPAGAWWRDTPHE
jgi:superfamily II DNA or RNA helicase